MHLYVEATWRNLPSLLMCSFFLMSFDVHVIWSDLDEAIHMEGEAPTLMCGCRVAEFTFSSCVIRFWCLWNAHLMCSGLDEIIHI